MDMATRPLPVIDPARAEFGFCRTVCACDDCRRGCRRVPGYLIPADLERLGQHLAPGEELVTWAARHLLASPGAVVARRGRAFRIPTLVPARRADGACTFLAEDGRCAVHVVTPFGCAFFDSHMDHAEADRRSIRGLRAVLDAWADGGPYARVWAALTEAGRRAPAPEACRPPRPDTPGAGGPA
jgi:hypothetical protein